MGIKESFFSNEEGDTTLSLESGTGYKTGKTRSRWVLTVDYDKTFTLLAPLSWRDEEDTIVNIPITSPLMEAIRQTFRDFDPRNFDAAIRTLRLNVMTQIPASEVIERRRKAFGYSGEKIGH